jgi:hypothetical protein
MTGWGMRHSPRPGPESGTGRTASGFGETIRKEFRALINALTVPVPRRNPKKRRTEGEVGRAFRITAAKLLRRISAVPAINATASLTLDVLAWLHLWDWNEHTAGQGVQDKSADHHDLSPQL